MKGVPTKGTEFQEGMKYDASQAGEKIWNVLAKCFNVDRESIVKTNKYMNQHLVEIVSDNLAGQCMKGHSCKNTTREALEYLLSRERKRASASHEAPD
jgi:hypothetical protein